ncbi:hypothetical protein M427DRAFT_152993 [Gonapodya prolifera JEL478]|uniref:Integrator complex subunit 4/Protein SIEL C-terminal Ig-like domain-containing protein n=1 Tax=Gonapodya prolifera (strain JEL478) TaxID=1344416 RepID=A0A139AP98_GONPJ|nr:hypothetical protein M427DRAFT_152993 [Gonapodya prolifera JEL478]|eukprot:KXS18581.1 hypothetical protein M427DRAFT_152993 [Gonapodya prolifera JEL478]
MRDDCDDVRMAAASFACSLAVNPRNILQPYPTILLPKSSHTTPPLFVNVVFLDVSLLITDHKPEVRLHIATLLRKFVSADPEWLALGLVKEALGGRQGNQHAQGKFHRQPKKARLANAVPSYAAIRSIGDAHLALVDPDSLGAFVHGLEDEVSAVREAAMDSLRHLTSVHTPLLPLSLPHLLALLNDDIPLVRKAACSAINLCAGGVMLTLESYNGALCALSDANHAVRGAAREMIGSLKLPSEGGIDALLLAADVAITRHPDEAQEVRRCLAAAGRSAWEVIEDSIEKLMGVEGVFVVKERRLDDAGHIARLCLISGAASVERRVLLKVPLYANAHLEHHCGIEPAGFPKIELENVESLSSVIDALIDQDDSDDLDLKRDYLADVVNRFTAEYEHSSSPKARETLAEVFAHNLATLSSSLPQALRGYCDVLRGYLQCCAIVEQLKEASFQFNPTTALRLCSKLVTTSYSMQFGTDGHTERGMVEMGMLRCFAHGVWCAMRVNERCPKGPSTRHLFSILCCRQERIRKALARLGDPSYKSLRVPEWSANIEEPNLILEWCTEMILNFVPPLPPTLIDPRNKPPLRTLSAKIVRPKNNADNPFQCPASLPFQVEMGAVINASSTSLASIVVEYQLPDGVLQWFKPHLADFTEISERKYKLKTMIPFVVGTWSDPAPICVWVSRTFTPDAVLPDIVMMNWSKQTSNQTLEATVRISTQGCVFWVHPKPVW